MRWPWQREEHRASATDALVSAILAAASGGTIGDHRAIAALETAVNFYAAAFATARVTTDDPRVAARLTPAFLAMVARALIRRGEFLAVLEATPARGLELHAAGSWDVKGGPAESSWIYRADLFGPSGSVSMTVPGAAVLHMRYAVDPARPWRGVSPLESASLTGVLAGNLEQRLGEETGASVGSFLPVPKADGTDPDDPDKDPLSELRGDIRNAKGRSILVESMATSWGEGPGAAPRGDWKSQRFGAAPPDILEALRSSVGMSVLNACGVPVSLAVDADGTSQRESWRRFVAGPVAALAAIVAAELQAKLDAPVTLSFTSLYASDLVGRASAFARISGEKLPSDTAREIVGL